MRFLLFFIPCILITTVLVAQQTTFSKVLEVSTDEGIHGFSMVSNTVGGYVINGSNGMFLETDSIGNVMWAKKTENYTSTHIGSIGFSKIISTKNQGFFMVGFAFNENLGRVEGLCIKTNSLGDTVWTKTFSENSYVYATSACQTSDSGFVIIGYTEHPETEITAVKLDMNGSLIWSKIMHIEANSNYAYSIKELHDSSLMIAGTYVNVPEAYKTIGYMINLDDDGNLKWSKKYYFEDERKDSQITDLVENQKGIVFYTQSDYFTGLVQTDFAGNIIWNKFYNNSGRDYMVNEGIHQLKRTYDNGFVFTYGSCGGGGLIKTDSLGNEFLSYRLEMKPVDIIETPQKELFVLGIGPMCGVKKSTNYISAQTGLTQVDTIGTSQNCAYYTDRESIQDTILCNDIVFNVSEGIQLHQIQLSFSEPNIEQRTGCVDWVGNITENKISVEVYPNPTKDFLNIMLLEPINAWISIYNIEGKEILKQQINGKESIMDLSNAYEGIYFYRITNDKKRLAVGKFVIKK